MKKELSHVILELHYVRMEPSSGENGKRTTKCDKRTVICDIGIANVRMKPSNVRKKKKRNHQM